MITDLIRRSFLVGLGALVLTRDKLEQFLADSVARGELSNEQAKNLLEELTSRADAERQKVEGMIRQQVQRVVEGAGLASRSDFTSLEDKIRGLEERISHISSTPTIRRSTDSRSKSTPAAEPIIVNPAGEPVTSAAEDRGDLPPHM